MHRIFRVKAHEQEHGPHFNEEHAHKAVMKMENEDGTHGPHWSFDQTIALANQYGISFSERFNKYDWFVALNMIYSDYCRVLQNIVGTPNNKHFVELTKAWLDDKDIMEGKMWHYYVYIMCNNVRNAEQQLYDEEMSKHYDDDDYVMYKRGSRRGRRSMNAKDYMLKYDDYDDMDYEPHMSYNRPTRYIRY